MQVWAEPFTTLRLQKVFNLFQDPFERADFTSNTFWDWNLRHVQYMYGVMDEVLKFAMTFKEYPPRSYPPSFNPSNIMEEAKRRLKARQALEHAFPMLKEGQRPEGETDRK
jgi:arylsulfatase